MRSTVELGSGRERFHAILQVPESTPTGAVLLLHGFTARKEEMADSIGRALLHRGVASIAPDLPLHGARANGLGRVPLDNPITLVTNWRLALREAAQCIEHLAARPGIDVDRLGVVGYSLGAYLSVFVAEADDRIDPVALVAGGDLPDNIPFVSVVRAIADPRRAVRSLGGRALFMMNGTRDRTITPAQARALFAAAEEPRELRWYDGPHWPPRSVIDEVADWVAARFDAQSRLSQAS